MPTRIQPPVVRSIPILSYDKVMLDDLIGDDWLFAVQNAVIIDGELYLTKWLNTGRA